MRLAIHWKLGLLVVWGVTLAGCAAASPSPPQNLTPSATAASPSISAKPIGLSATTQPADVAPDGAIAVDMSSFMFEPMAISAKAGTVTFFLRNVGVGVDPIALQNHNLVIGLDQAHVLARSDYVSAGKAAVFTVEGLEPGDYVIWCSVPGHAGNGMVGTLTVSP